MPEQEIVGHDKTYTVTTAEIRALKITLEGFRWKRRCGWIIAHETPRMIDSRRDPAKWRDIVFSTPDEWQRQVKWDPGVEML